MIKLALSPNEQGFSLVEIILVVVIIGFIILIVSNLPASIQLIGSAQHSSAAKDIAAQIVEDARSQTYDNLADGKTQVSDYRLASLPSGASTKDIEDCPGTICKNGEQIKEVTATVTWKEGPNTKNISINTLISKGGLK